VERDEPLNYSKFLFKQEEFEERVDSKFVNVRKKYDEILRIKKSIQNIKKENNKDNDNLKMIVNRLADKQKTIMKKINSGKQDKSVVIN
jgi:DNA anti-recombination protein RmuC